MVVNYRDYKPLVLDTVTIEQIRSPQYVAFLRSAVLEPGVRLLLARRALRPDWPFVDTKFNPNSGADLSADAYNVIYCWFLGRGSEALAGHLSALDSFTGLSPAERAEAKSYFRQLIQTMTQTIVRVMAANQGRCPFRIGRDLKAIDSTGRPAVASPKSRSAGDTFCAKGLIAEGTPENVKRGVAMILDCAEYIRANAYDSDQGEDLTAQMPQGERMLIMALPQLVQQKTADRALRGAILDLAAEFMEFVLDTHVDPATLAFSEYVRIGTLERLPYLDPGHANEFVGLGLGAVAAMERETTWLNDARRALLKRAREMMPALLVKSTRIGWNHTHHGLHKAVDNRTGAPINNDMPWWNLPETMRAAVRAHAATSDPQVRKDVLECYRLSHNAYFEHFLNRDKMLFPCQTRSGATGQVVNKVPAVPEGDPLYHTNLSLLDMLAS